MALLTRHMRQGRKRPQLPPATGLETILLGTGTPLPSKKRACASILVRAGNNAFLVDTGRGFLDNFAKTGLADVNAVFFTHYHSDHFGEFGEFMVTRTLWGANQPLVVIGPPGAKLTIGQLLDAYALDDSYRKTHHGTNWSENGMRAVIQEETGGVVYNQDGVTVTMFPVDHQPVTPAVGYRFSYQNQVVVISGDTKRVPIMVEFAQGANILVHEVANKTFVDWGQKFIDPRWKEIGHDVLEYHALTHDVAEIARDAHVKKLVLTHFVPGLPVNWFFEALYRRGMSRIYKGKIIMGRDGMRIHP